LHFEAMAPTMRLRSIKEVGKSSQTPSRPQRTSRFHQCTSPR